MNDRTRPDRFNAEDLWDPEDPDALDLPDLFDPWTPLFDQPEFDD